MSDLSNFLVDSQGYGGQGKFSKENFEINVKPFSHAEVVESHGKDGEFISACFHLSVPAEDGSTMKYAYISKTQECNVGDVIPLDKVKGVLLTDKQTGEQLKPRVEW